MAELPTGDLILICPQGEQYSMVSDADFAKMSDLSMSLFKLEEVETDVWAAWAYNARLIEFSASAPIGGEGEYRRGAYVAGEEEMVFADEFSLPTSTYDDSQSFYRDEKGILFHGIVFTGRTEAIMLSPYGDSVYNYYFRESDEAPMPSFGRMLYHREKWYLAALANTPGSTTQSHTVSVTLDELIITTTTTFPLDPETPDSVLTRTWTITETFH